MCGFTGFIDSLNPGQNYPEILKKMSKTLVHRGPDDQGIWYDETAGIGLAHQRLSILDLSNQGRQPMVSASKRFVIAYNGEIYNFDDIRYQLEKAHHCQWHGHSDTEVILEAIEAWGLEKAVNEFIGMFAFALWDVERRYLHLCRDRLGIKPLYYAKLPKGIVFGSELKPIMRYPNFRPAINRDALTLYFRHNYIPAPYTIYKNTWKLSPGRILSVSLDGLNNGRALPGEKTYWSASSMAQAGQGRVWTGSAQDAVGHLETLIKNAIKLRMVSDVPLGAFLSGGIDSSLVAALMQAQSSGKIKTFSIGFKEAGFNEAGYAKAVARHIGTDHTELYVTPDQALQVIPDLPKLYDEPFSDASQIPSFLLSKLTREHVTVSLSGDGGDELFGGYDRYFWCQNIWKGTRCLPRKLRHPLARMVEGIPPVAWDKLLAKMTAVLPHPFKMDMPGDRIHKLAGLFGSQTPEAIYYQLISHWKHPENLVIKGSEPLTRVTHPSQPPGFPGFIHRMMLLDLVTYLPDDILVKMDRAGMGAGLEVRMPMLDHRVVEFAWQLPLNLKVKGNAGKWILRQLLYKYVPQNLVERPKAGFAVPIANWLRGPLKEWAASLLDEKRLREEGFLNPWMVQKKWGEHLAEKRNWQYDLWDVLLFQAWKEYYSAD